VASETLAASVTFGPLADAATETVDVDGHALAISIKKVT
jgi:hypothetical protein